MAPKDQPLTETDAAESPSQAFARWAAGVDGAFPAEALRRAKRAFIDVVACLVPGAAEEAAAIVRRVAAGWGAGPSTVVGSGAGQPPPVAALVNGTAAHALDFDDNFDPAKAHITAVLAPALLALGEARGARGRDVLVAYIVGLQIATRVGQGLNPLHRNRGWHATATVGAVGAAAACGRLLGLDAAKMRHCLNMSTSFAGGFMSQFGSMTKPLHAGKAAEAGVACAVLAEAGLTAGAETFDGPTGMARLMVGPDLDAVRAAGAFTSEHGQTLRFDSHAVGEPLAILQYGLKVKRFPTCASTHRALDAVLALRARNGFTADDVARVDVHAPVTHFNNLMYTDPADGMQAKFSMEYCVAVAVRNGGVGLADFTPAAVADPRVRALMPRVRRHPVDRAESEFPTRVDVALKDGRVLSAEVDAPKGRADNPLTDAELWDKLRQCCRDVLPAAETGRLAAALDALDQDAPIGEVMAPLRHVGVGRAAVG
jgi:2-methylcitrate dehydratase PrpD